MSAVAEVFRILAMQDLILGRRLAVISWVSDYLHVYVRGTR
jgi:hypothetical protein